ncbi:MAG: uroporphyrinogen-III synthase [Acidobacteria bacterium]|nr:uroporphyrinogen-III synthase [Acidobacteriota bacterium]
MSGLSGLRVALLESRLSGELAEIVRRFGGAPIAAPAVREVPRLETIPPFIDALISGRFSVVIFLTGVGATTLLEEAKRLGSLDGALAALRATTIACRGPKPSAALRRYEVPVHVKPVEPYTTTELLDALGRIELDGKAVALVHYGEPNQALADALKARGAKLDECALYEWMLPEDHAPLGALIHDLIDKRVDAIAFTSQVQCRHLFEVAAKLGTAEALARVLNDHTIVAVIGPVCAAALRAQGVTPDVIPAHPKMGPLIAALADYVEASHGRR